MQKSYKTWFFSASAKKALSNVKTVRNAIPKIEHIKESTKKANEDLMHLENYFCLIPPDV